MHVTAFFPPWMLLQKKNKKTTVVTSSSCEAHRISKTNIIKGQNHPLICLRAHFPQLDRSFGRAVSFLRAGSRTCYGIAKTTVQPTETLETNWDLFSPRLPAIKGRVIIHAVPVAESLRSQKQFPHARKLPSSSAASGIPQTSSVGFACGLITEL